MHEPDPSAPSQRDRAIFRATKDDLTRLYRHTEETVDSEGGQHLQWNGSLSMMISVQGVLVRVSRLALYGYTGRLYDQLKKLCANNYCVHPAHYEWDKASALIRRDCPPPRFQEDPVWVRAVQAGLIHSKFQNH